MTKKWPHLETFQLKHALQIPVLNFPGIERRTTREEVEAEVARRETSMESILSWF